VRSLSVDGKVVGCVALLGWLLLFGNTTIVQVDRDAPLWHLFPGLWGGAWLLGCGLLAASYPLRDHRLRERFTPRARVLHFAAILASFVVIPTIAAIVLRETGKPYTYVHDGAIMVEEAARKLLMGQNPYLADYLDTPLFYWPMINNPALYHLTYFPAMFLVTVPFVFAFDRAGLVFDQRYLYLPAYLAAALAVALVITAGPDRVRTTALRLSLAAVVVLHPQLFPFVPEGRNDFFVLLFVFAGIALLVRERRTLGVLALAVAAASKLHAGPLLLFALAYLWWSDRPLERPRRLARLAAASWAGALVLAVTFVPFLVDNFGAFWDDIVLYNGGGSAWSYPVAGIGFSAMLRALGVISYPQQEFPFAAFQLAAGIPAAAWSLRRLRRDPHIATMLGGFALTMLAFTFFGRYLHGNHVGFLMAVAAPIPFLRPQVVSAIAARLAIRREPAPMPASAVMAPVAITDEGDQAAK
jgi:hypothetical protein